LSAAGDDRFVDRVFLTRRGRTPKLVRCAVLFVDLLGVRAMNRGPDREVRGNLIALERAVSGTYQDFLDPASTRPAALFSDTLVLAEPVGDQGEGLALGGLVRQASQLQSNLIAQGFFMRGALALGDFHIRDGVIFGPALVEAAELEHDVAVHPRIVLSREAEASRRRELRATGGLDDSLLLQDNDGWTFIDYVTAALLEDARDPRPGVELHRDAILRQLAANRTDKRVWEKYRWVAEYHNHFVGQWFRRDAELAIAASEMTWTFSPFA
jgi:hypothetical protein